MYQKHDMETIKFEDNNVFVTEWLSDGEEGEDQYSLRPDRSDK